MTVDWSAMEAPLRQSPEFPVQGPRGLVKRPEIDVQSDFRKLMAALAPKVMVYANANAGKRNPAQARKEGIRGGVFDLTCVNTDARIAFVEFKGWDRRGTPGKLSDAQIDFGNDLVRRGVPAACFCHPVLAVDWLRTYGFEIRGMR